MFLVFIPPATVILCMKTLAANSASDVVKIRAMYNNSPLYVFIISNNLAIKMLLIKI
jgi:hypothetical protein